MKYSFSQLNDLPDELLVMIFKKMKKALALYSLMGINRRFDRILRGQIFVSHLTLMTCTSNDLIYPMYKKTIDRFCLHILPQIHRNVKWLNLEASSMERLLLATEYPNLRGLGLYNIREETDEHIFSDESSFAHIFKNQISTLVITITKNKNTPMLKDTRINIFKNILSIFANLRHLNVNTFSKTYIKPLSLNWHMSQKTFSSSNLKELHIKLHHFNDCLYLLDGYFDQLEKFYVNIDIISPHPSTINDKEKLPNLKWFSLDSDARIEFYYELILPLLHRMSNLESLALDLMVIVYHEKGRFIDGNDLKGNIIDHLPRLNKFAFSIHSTTFFNQIHLPSNEDIQNTFTSFKDNQIMSYIDYSRNKTAGQCHIYSLPYTMKHYKNITNNFPGGLFKHVRVISLSDCRPFEHEFFIRISQAFPFLKILSLRNREPQQHKQSQRSVNENSQESSIIEYPHLSELNLADVHDDYVEQFLDDTKTCLPKKVKLKVDYDFLQRATHSFTRETTRINCAKINNLTLYHPCQMTDQFKMYFPLIKSREMLPY